MKDFNANLDTAREICNVCQQVSKIGWRYGPD